MSDKTLFLPEKEAKYLGPLLALIDKGRSFSSVWLPSAGMRTTFSYLAQKYSFPQRFLILLMKSEVFQETNAAFFQLLNYKLSRLGRVSREKTSFSSSGNPYFVFRDQLEQVIKKGCRIVFLLQGFDQLDLERQTYDNLFYLWQAYRPQLSFVFGLSREISLLKSKAQKFSFLLQVISAQIIYFPLLDCEQMDYAADRMIEKYSYRIEAKSKEAAINLAGGHVGFLRALLRLADNQGQLSLKQLEALAFQDNEIQLRFRETWQSFTEDERRVLISIIQGGKIKQLPSRLKAIKLVINQAGEQRIGLPLFEQYLRWAIKERHLPLSQLRLERKRLVLRGRPVEHYFSPNETRFLVALLKLGGRVLSRDRVAEILWGNQVVEKYSDWAIDQLVSQTRKKLIGLGLSSRLIQTVRSQGWRWLG